MEEEQKTVKYGIRMQSGNNEIHWAGITIYDTTTIDINLAHKYCSEYNTISANAPFDSIQRNTKYWIEEKL